MKALAEAVVRRLASLRGPPSADVAAPNRRPTIIGEGTAGRTMFAKRFVPPSEHTRIATPEDIFYCFRLLLGRCPNLEEWPGHSSRAGEDLENIVSGFVTSYEFTARGLLNKIYRDKIELVQLPNFFLFVSTDDLAVGQHVLNNRSYDPEISAALSRRIKPGMAVVDIGANIGYLTMLLATLVTRSGRVVAIEPNPDNIKLLEASRRLNGFDQVRVFPVAAGRENGLLALSVSYSNGMTGELPSDLSAVLASRVVPCFALDAILPRDRRIDLVKIDVEGAELNALIGLAETIERDRPIIISEFSPGTMPGISHCTGPEYLQYLIGKGYRIGVIGENDASEAMFEADADAIMSAYARRGVDHIDIIAIAG